MFIHYVAIDWAKSTMAIARMSPKSERIHLYEGPSDIKYVKDYLDELHNQVYLTFEESTYSQWLYTEFRDHVDKLVVCEPYRNHLLKEGPKTDKIDAQKLVKLLRADMLKPVYHSCDKFIYLRKLVSGYKALVKMGVRYKNQKSSLYYSAGSTPNVHELTRKEDVFVLEGIERGIEIYDEEKERYLAEFKKLSTTDKTIKVLKSLPGIADVGAVKIAALVVDPRRFPNKNHFLSYCGLIKHQRMSGGKSYGSKSPRCCLELKQVFKTAAITSIQSSKNNFMRDYYLYLIQEKKLAEHQARHQVSRRIAILAYGILKSQRKYDRKKIKK